MMNSENATDGLNTRIPWSLRGYDECELQKLDVSLLRTLCYERQLLSKPLAKMKTCIKTLLDWKKSRQNAVIPLSLSLMEEGGNLLGLLQETHFTELRNLCRERNLDIMGDPLYHKQHCIDLLLAHQRRSIDLAKMEEENVGNTDVETPVARSPVLLRSRVKGQRMHHDSCDSPINESPINEINKGDVLQLLVAGRWHKCTVIHVGRNGVCNVLWARDESVDVIDLSSSTDKNMRKVDEHLSNEVNSISTLPIPISDAMFDDVTSKLPLEFFLRRTAMAQEKEKASCLIASVIGKLFRIRIHEKISAAIIIQSSVRAFFALCHYKSLKRNNMFSTAFGVDTTVTLSSLLAQLKAVSELLKVVKLNLDIYITRQPFPDEVLLMRKESPADSPQHSVPIKTASSIELIHAVSEATAAAGQLARTSFLAQHIASKSVNDSMEEKLHPTAIPRNTIEEHRRAYLRVPAVEPVDAFVRGVFSSSSMQTAQEEAPRYFILSLLESLSDPGAVPFALAWIGQKISRTCTWALRQEIHVETGVIATPWHAKDAINAAVSASWIQSSAIGTVAPCANTIAVQVDSDNFERKFGGDIANTTSVLERLIKVNETNHPLLHLRLQDSVSLNEIPMEKANLEFDAASWLGDAESDCFVSYLFARLAEGASEVELVTPWTLKERLDGDVFGDHRRSQWRWDYGIDPVNYALDGNVSVKVGERVPITDSRGDGLNVFTRNSVRILAQRPLQYALGETLDALHLESSKFASSQKLPLILAGDGAPVKYFANQIKCAIRKSGLSASNLTATSSLPLIPPSQFQMELALTLDEGERRRLSSLKQHVVHIDPATGQASEVANSEWLSARKMRFTASAAATFVPAALKDLTSTSDALTYFKSHENLIDEKNWGTFLSCRPPVRNKIEGTFSGNKFTAIGNKFEATALEVSSRNINEKSHFLKY